MFARIKTDARYAMLASGRKGFLPWLAPAVLLAVTGAVFFFFDLPWFVSVGQSVLAQLILSACRLYIQVKLIRSAKGLIIKDKLRFLYFCRFCLLRLIVLLHKLKEFVIYESLPLALSVLFVSYLYYNPVSLNAFYAISAGIILLFAAGAFFFVLSLQKYSRAEFLLAAYPSLSAADAVKLSRMRPNGEDRKIVLFKLSFLPWFAACIFILPLPFVLLYYKQSITCYFMSR